MTREEFQAQLPGLVKAYKPAPEVLERIKSISVLMLIGPSGSGKTTLINKIPLPYAPTDTTRLPRPGEQHGVDFYFRTNYAEVFEDIKKGHFVQIAHGAEGDLYATRDTSYPTKGMAVMAVMADVVPVFRELGFARTISAFITPPTYTEWQRRTSSHELSKQQLKKRLAEAERSLSFALSDSEIRFILNDDLELAVSQLKNIINGKVDAQREQKARTIAQLLLGELRRKLDNNNRT